MTGFSFSDIHCHSTLKSYGSSFRPNGVDRKADFADLWHERKANSWRTWLATRIGFVRYTQCDLQKLLEGNVTSAFTSCYPVEKGFFENPYLPARLTAAMGNMVTHMGYGRIRNIQRHQNYFQDLLQEELFLRETPGLTSREGRYYEVSDARLPFLNGRTAPSPLKLFPTIEGAHALNTGLGKYGRPTEPVEVLENIRKIKAWKVPPVFITLAHNFQNDLCGHARSLDRMGPLADQSRQMDAGFTRLGLDVVEELLDGVPIYIDLKHMSIPSRQTCYNIVQQVYHDSVPLIVSHGAVTGCSFAENISHHHRFASEDINFYDEELIRIADSKGLFGLQMDASRLADKATIRHNQRGKGSKGLQHSALIIWEQLRHIAEVLDDSGRFAWGISCIGSDFDGTIIPLNGIFTSSDFPQMADHLLPHVSAYLRGRNALTLAENKSISPEEVVARFATRNVDEFMGKAQAVIYEATGSDQ